MKLKIITVPNPVLRQKSKPIAKIDGKVKRLADSMIRIIKEGPEKEPIGVGLSAVQIGQTVRLIVVYNPKIKDYTAYINPEIINRSTEMLTEVPDSESNLEGCLSIPDYFGLVQRHKWLVLRYRDLDNKEHQEKYSGFPAVVIQHECDHLDGVLFIDRIMEQKGKLYHSKNSKNGQELVLIPFDQPLELVK